MKLPNWFRILTAGLTWVLYRRYPDLVAGHAAAVDVFVFAVWVAYGTAFSACSMALHGVSWVRGGLVETALAAGGLAVRQNRRHPSLPSLGSFSTWELVSVSDLWRQ
jgi:hypothetical protein